MADHHTANALETPPRAWGRPLLFHVNDYGNRNTPTGVGKTPPLPCERLRQQKHPHGRGEDSATFRFSASLLETPPRAWGRLLQLRNRELGAETPPRAWGRREHTMIEAQPARNTPTGVGKTLIPLLRIVFQKKHPHGRGEDRHACLVKSSGAETPPRAWGRLELSLHGLDHNRNTPTGVGKTWAR